MIVCPSSRRMCVPGTNLYSYLKFTYYFCVFIIKTPLDAVEASLGLNEQVQVGKDQEKAQSEKDSHSKNRGGKKPN